MRPEFKAPLGAILLRHGLLTAAQLAYALSLQKRDGGRLGDILIGEGMIAYYPLYRAVAESHGLPFVDLLTQLPDRDLLHREDVNTYLRLRLVPWRSQAGQMVIAVCEVNVEVMVWIRTHFGTRSRLVITSPVDIRRTVEILFGTSMEKASCLSLWEALPHSSARVTVYRRGKCILLLLCATTLALSVMAPMSTALYFILLCQLVYMVTMLFKCGIFMTGSHPKRAPPASWDDRLATLDTQTLPVYTILIPMYKEAASLPGMLSAMEQLDYPSSKLDIKLVLEADDDETMDAAYALKPRYQFEIIRVPPGQPRTKPKACNYALCFARGEFVTIFDADDQPEPLQLKKAVHTFRTLPETVICLQARLNYYNAGDNVLTRFFSLEYSILFNVLLHGLQYFGIPIPLGGTSNHMSLAHLRALGEWDPFNVTEDADLGTRLAARGFHTAMLDSITLEEAPNQLGPWIAQRSRWIKGYMQTWLVHMRHPFQLYRALGWKSFLGFHFFIGLATFTFLTAPLLWMLSLLWVGNALDLHRSEFPAWMSYLTLINLTLNFLSHWYFTLHCALRYPAPRRPFIIAAMLFPFYLILHSIASYKALWQLCRNPHFWEKTMHGVAYRSQNQSFSLTGDMVAAPVTG